MGNKSNFDGMPMLADLIDFTSESPSATDEPLSSLVFPALLIFAVLGAIILVSSAYHIYLMAQKRETTQTIVTALSLYANSKKIFTAQNTDEILCLHGIKTICMFLIITFHHSLQYVLVPVENQSDFLAIISSIYYHPQIQIPELSVDAFLVVGGFLAAQSLLRSLDKKFSLRLFYLHRWLRLTPSLSVVLLIYVGLLNHLGAGPLWKNMDILLVRNCKKYWWSVLSYTQNYINPKDICIPQTWYVSVDMQLFISASLILLLMHRKPLLLYSVLGLLSFLSIAFGFGLAWYFNFYALFTKNLLKRNFGEYFHYYYVPAHTRMAPYLFGVLLGHVVHTSRSTRKQIAMTSGTVTSAWIVTAISLTACLYGEHFLQFTSNEKLATALYASLVRPVWAVGICWIIFACTTGNGGIINDFLSLRLFQILSRLSYNVSLVHCGIIFMGSFRHVVPLHFDLFYSTVELWGYIMISLGCATVITVCVELPVAEIEKLMLKRCGAREVKKIE